MMPGAESTSERDHWHGVAEALRDQRDLARAELASARVELDAVRTARDNLDRELARAQARIAELTLDLGAVISTYGAWACLTDGGCARWLAGVDAPLSHHCGPLTAVRVTLTHRTEGAPPT
jgi:hypothetical protein